MTITSYFRALAVATALMAMTLPTPALAMPPCSFPARVHVETHKTIDKIGHVRLLAIISVAAPDSINSITFGQMHNASVIATGPQPAVSGQTVTFPASTTTVEMLVERTGPGGAVMVPFTVHDGCGAWLSFVGGGMTAF